MFLESTGQVILVEEPVAPAITVGPGGEVLESAEMQKPQEVVFVIEELPGAPAGTHDPEPVEDIVVEEEDKKEKESDENDAKSKPANKWDWSKHGHEGFVVWIQERLTNVPKHSGYDSAGLERAVSYLEKLDAEISKAMRMDVDGNLDANKIEDVRSKIENGIEKLQDRLDKVKKSKKKIKKKGEEDFGLIKEGQRILGVSGVVVTVPLLISRIARFIVRNNISYGRDIEALYNEQCEEYNLNKREKSEVVQLLEDMGYPINHTIPYGYGLDPNKEIVEIE